MHLIMALVFFGTAVDMSIEEQWVPMALMLIGAALAVTFPYWYRSIKDRDY